MLRKTPIGWRPHMVLPNLKWTLRNCFFLTSTQTLLFRFPALSPFYTFSLSLHFFSSHSDVLNFENYLSGKDGRKPQAAGSRKSFWRKGASPFQVAGKSRSIKPLNKVHALKKRPSIYTFLDLSGCVCVLLWWTGTMSPVIHHYWPMTCLSRASMYW